MRVKLALLLATFVLISGCGPAARPAAPVQDPPPPVASGAPAPAAPVSAPVPAAKPSAAPAPGLWAQLDAAASCNTKLAWPQREKALTAALPAILGNQTASQIEGQLTNESSSAAASCLRIETVPEYDGLLISTFFLNSGGALLAVHRSGDWQVIAVQPPGPDWGMTEVLYSGVARAWDQGPDVIFVGGLSGSAGYKGLLRGRPSDSGRLKLTSVSQVYWKTGFHFLGTDFVVATQSAEELGPVFETCNACQPIKQTLLKWSGETYAEVGTRVVSTPYLAANLFLGAVQAGDNGKALQYAANDSILKKVRIPTDRHLSLDASACRNIDEIESDNWDLLPAAFRQSLSPALGTCSVKFGDTATLQMRRNPGGWVVADLWYTGE